jgi:F0F1-type ATP synthase delta subunit
MAGSRTPRHVIAAALARRSLTSGGSAKLSIEIAAYLLSERRAGELESIMRDIMQYRADQGIVEVVAVSAFPLSVEVRGDVDRQVRSLYPGVKEVIISERINPSVVAGVRLEFANQQLDTTVRNKLNTFKQATASVGR